MVKVFIGREGEVVQILWHNKYARYKKSGGNTIPKGEYNNELRMAQENLSDIRFDDTEKWEDMNCECDIIEHNEVFKFNRASLCKCSIKVGDMRLTPLIDSIVIDKTE